MEPFRVETYTAYPYTQTNNSEKTCFHRPGKFFLAVRLIKGIVSGVWWRLMISYRVRVVVKEVKGYCALGLKPGDEFTIEKFYFLNQQNAKICLHALIGMSSLLIPFLRGISARELGIGMEDDVGYIQCPDPGKPYTNGGTVIFELKREKIH